MSSIKELIQKLNGDMEATDNVFVASVISVDEATLLCKVSPSDGDADVEDVRLIANTEKKGMILIPKQNSDVIVVMESPTNGYIFMFSEIEKILIDCDQIVFNGGQNKGFVKIDSLISKLNNLENKVNELIGSYKNHNHLHPQGNTTGFLVPYSGANLTKTVVSDLENPKIKH